MEEVKRPLIGVNRASFRPHCQIGQVSLDLYFDFLLSRLSNPCVVAHGLPECASLE